MTGHKQGIIFFTIALLLVGCATIPTGPRVMVLPGPGKPFDVFQTEDATCRRWAQQQLGGQTPQDVANQNTAQGAVAGTAIGAGIGALAGAASGDAGGGAAVGAVTGLLLGASSGAQAGEYSAHDAQRMYDNAYVQCMYASGNTVPGVVRSRSYRRMPPPPPREYEEVPPDYSGSQLPPPPPPGR
jgi:hypothetical protein